MPKTEVQVCPSLHPAIGTDGLSQEVGQQCVSDLFRTAKNKVLGPATVTGRG